MSPLKRGVRIETDYLNDSRVLSVYFKGKERTDKYLLLSVHIVKYRHCPFSATSCLVIQVIVYPALLVRICLDVQKSSDAIIDRYML